jgi:hypothetical protein
MFRRIGSGHEGRPGHGGDTRDDRIHPSQGPFLNEFLKMGEFALSDHFLDKCRGRPIDSQHENPFSFISIQDIG